MLSILIPTYHYKVYDLVCELQKQCEGAGIAYEIICQDDHSDSENNLENEKINLLEHCSFSSNAENLGRSKNRNVLVQKSKFPYLLFLDADTFPMQSNFIVTYLSEIRDEIKILYGGIRYQEQRPNQKQVLRWIYGRKREALTVDQRNKNVYLSFLTLNFLIHKDVFQSVSFNEDIPNMRHEDTLFSFELKKNDVPIKHIENPVYHYGLDDFDKALLKEHESLQALKNLIENGYLPTDYVKLSKLFSKITKFKLKFFVAFGFKCIRPILQKNISSSNPSLILFDVYRLGYICTI